MRLIESKVEYLPQPYDLWGVFMQVEKAGRTAYKSERKITSDSAKAFVEKLIKARHYAALEHGTIYLSIPRKDKCKNIIRNKYSALSIQPKTYELTTNYRVIIENHFQKFLTHMCEPSPAHERRYTFRFTCSRGIAQQLTRHRAFSFLMESQRYVNYAKRGIEFIIPYWCKLNPGPYEYKDGKIVGDGYLKDVDSKEPEGIFLRHMGDCESTYNILIEDHKLKPEQARDLLPMATKTELVMTGYAKDWQYLLDLRLFGSTGKPHPDMVILMQKLRDIMESAGIWEDVMKGYVFKGF